jgi:iron-sulfur cluster repair protein YtfE (RIC family)
MPFIVVFNDVRSTGRMEMEMQQGNYTQQNDAHANRVDIYAGIHKAVRAFLCDTLTRLASLDVDDESEVAGTLSQVRELLEFCEHHIANEEKFVHPAMEARRPGSAAGTAADHLEHAESVAAMLADCTAIDSGHGAARVEAWRRLQRRLARFTGDNLAHMDHEETANNAVLHACYTDGELIALHQQILASLSPQELATGLRWVLTGSSPAERTQVMAGIRADAPPPVFEAMLDMARQSLAASAWNKLAVSLAPARIAA